MHYLLWLLMVTSGERSQQYKELKKREETIDGIY